MPGTILCVDIGTSSLKAAFIDLEGRLRAFAREPYRQDRAEAAAWEAAFDRALSRLPGGSPPLAVCVSGNGPTLVPVTPDDQALAPLHWYDAGISAPPGAAGPSFFLPRAAWFMEQRPKDYAKTRYLFSAQEWLSWRLGAEPVTVLPSAAYEPYYWDRGQCAGFGVDYGRFPPMTALGSFIGRTRPREGLAGGIPLAAGAPDFIMALIGTGVLEPGMVCDRAGSSEGINVCIEAPRAAPGLRTLPHAAPGRWNLGAVLPASGRLFDWYRSVTGQQDMAYARTLEGIFPGGTVNAPPETDRRTAIAALYLQGEAAALRFPHGLPDREELGRTVLESLGFMVRRTLGRLADEGFPVAEMRLSGGQAKSPLWNRLKADITGTRLAALEIPDGELAGDACAAAFALGEAADFAEASRRMIRIQAVFEPDQAVHARYTERYERYREQEREISADGCSV